MDAADSFRVIDFSAFEKPEPAEVEIVYNDIDAGRRVREARRH